MVFEDSINAAYKQSRSILSIGLDPLPEIIPYGHDLRSWLKGAIDATYKDALLFKANFSGYIGRGEDLETLKYACGLSHERGRPFVIDCKANDVGFTAAEYARRYLKEVGADACTVNAIPWLNDVIDSFIPHLDEKAIFVLTYTTSPNSEMFWSTSRMGGLPTWKFVALKVANEWTQKLAKQDYSPIGIVAGPRDENLAREIREICDTQFILCPGLGKQGVPIKNLKYLRKKGAKFPGMIGNVGRDIMGEWKKFPDEDPFVPIKRKTEEWNKKLSEALMI